MSLSLTSFSISFWVGFFFFSCAFFETPGLFSEGRQNHFHLFMSVWLFVRSLASVVFKILCSGFI